MLITQCSVAHVSQPDAALAAAVREDITVVRVELC